MQCPCEAIAEVSAIHKLHTFVICTVDHLTQELVTYQHRRDTQATVLCVIVIASCEKSGNIHVY